MADAKQCDRCGSVATTSEWNRNLRMDAVVKEHGKAATAYSPTEYELCGSCVMQFVDWVVDGKRLGEDNE